MQSTSEAVRNCPPDLRLDVRIYSWNNLEARVGIEPTHKGFADLSLTTWVPRLTQARAGRIERNGLPDFPPLGAMEWRNAALVGAGDRGRTGDIFLGKEALYH